MTSTIALAYPAATTLTLRLFTLVLPILSPSMQQPRTAVHGQTPQMPKTRCTVSPTERMDQSGNHLAHKFARFQAISTAQSNRIGCTTQHRQLRGDQSRNIGVSLPQPANGRFTAVIT